MKKVIFISATTLLVVAVLGGLGVGYVILGGHPQGEGGRPPASAINAAEAPKFDPLKSTPPVTAEKPAECQLPTEFKLPTELDIVTPQVPEGLSAPASPQKT